MLKIIHVIRLTIDTTYETFKNSADNINEANYITLTVGSSQESDSDVKYDLASTAGTLLGSNNNVIFKITNEFALSGTLDLATNKITFTLTKNGEKVSDTLTSLGFGGIVVYAKPHAAIASGKGIASLNNRYTFNVTSTFEDGTDIDLTSTEFVAYYAGSRCIVKVEE